MKHYTYSVYFQGNFIRNESAFGWPESVAIERVRRKLTELYPVHGHECELRRANTIRVPERQEQQGVVIPMIAHGPSTKHERPEAKNTGGEVVVMGHAGRP